MIETIKSSLIIFHGIVSILLVLSILFQPSKSDDLGSMFGGSSESVFGADSSLRHLSKVCGAIPSILASCVQFFADFIPYE